MKFIGGFLMLVDRGPGQDWFESREIWIETALCTSCDECTRLNPRLFAYNENKQAFIKDPKGGPYRDLVKAAEKCTVQIIHPGMPQDPKEKDSEKLMKRAAKYN